jgi:hypothetical protein
MSMFQQGFSYDLQPAFLTKGSQHLAEDFGLHIREDVGKGLQGNIEITEVGLVGSIVAMRGRGAGRCMRVNRGSSEYRGPHKGGEDGGHVAAVGVLNARQAGIFGGASRMLMQQVPGSVDQKRNKHYKM